VTGTERGIDSGTGREKKLPFRSFGKKKEGRARKVEAYEGGGGGQVFHFVDSFAVRKTGFWGDAQKKDRTGKKRGTEGGWKR